MCSCERGGSDISHQGPHNSIQSLRLVPVSAGAGIADDIMASSSGMAVEFPSSSRTAARLRHIHAHLAAAAQEVEEELYSDPDPDRVEYTSHDTDEVVAAIKRDGCALLKGVLSRETAARLGSLLTGYEALPHEAGMQILKDGRINSSQNAITIMFNRDPAWLACVDPEPVVKAMDAILCPSHVGIV